MDVLSLAGTWLGRCGGTLVALGLAAGCCSVHAASEGALKAAFVFNFAKFIEWPAGSFATPQSPLTLCLLRGRDGYAGAFADVEGRPVQGRTLQLRYGVRPGDLRSCHIVYFDDADARQAPEALRALRGAPVLTVGDIEDFAVAGGVIGLVAQDERIRFEINVDAAQHAQLKLGSQLISLGRVVKGRQKD